MTRRAGESRRRKRARCQARIERLEERLALATFLVTNTNDLGAGSFRQAVIDATNVGTADNITFDTAGVFATPQTISLLSALPQITNAGGALSITGTGVNNLTIRRDPGAGTNFRIFDSLAPSLSMVGFTITGGNPAASGGGILASGSVVLDGMAVSGNSATGNGGGIRMNTGGFLYLRFSTVSGNTASLEGGGVSFENGGSLLVENSTISGNIANSAVASTGGGGVSFIGTASAVPPGGFTPSALVIRNSTIALNSAITSGGGIELSGFIGTLLVQNSTITGNSAGNSAPGQGGGGISRLSGTGTVTLTNSVVSGNNNIAAPDILSAGTVNANFSAVGSLTGLVLSGPSGNNIAPGTNLLLGGLVSHGGPTLTISPMSGSPLVGTGSNGLIPGGVFTDQRGFGFDRIVDSVVDIGAVEVQPPKVTINQASGQQDPTRFTPVQFTVTFNVPVTGFNGSDVNFTGSTIGGAFANVTGAGANYTVSVVGMNGTGLLVVSIPIGAAMNLSGTLSAASTSTDSSVFFDNIPPTVLGPMFNFNAPHQSISFNFSEPVIAPPPPSQILLMNTTTATPVPTANIILAGGGPVSATYEFPGYPFGALPDGNYQMTVMPGVTDLIGNPLLPSAPFNFFFKNADANRDRRVDVHDLTIIAANWKGSNKNFSQADFNYDDVVNKADLGIMALLWHQALAQPAPALPAEPVVAPPPARAPARTPVRVISLVE